MNFINLISAITTRGDSINLLIRQIIKSTDITDSIRVVLKLNSLKDKVESNKIWIILDNCATHGKNIKIFSNKKLLNLYFILHFCLGWYQ